MGLGASFLSVFCGVFFGLAFAFSMLNIVWFSHHNILFLRIWASSIELTFREKIVPFSRNK